MKDDKIFENNQQDFEKNMHDFIGIEVQTSLTFAEIALMNPNYRAEDRGHARKGYDTALRFIAEAQARFPDHPVSARSLEGLEKLKQMLKELGEHV